MSVQYGVCVHWSSAENKDHYDDYLHDTLQEAIEHFDTLKSAQLSWVQRIVLKQYETSIIDEVRTNDHTSSNP